MIGRVPTSEAASEAASRMLGERPISLSRFTPGSSHWFYDAAMPRGGSAVIRLTSPDRRGEMASALHLNTLLRPRGVPLPAVLGQDLEGAFPAIALERLPGTDLGHVINGMGAGALEAVADGVARAQSATAGLDGSGRHGYAPAAGEAPHASWPDFLEAEISKLERRLVLNGLFDPGLADEAREAVSAFIPKGRDIRPTPFLPDTTLKNVIVSPGGILSGIVDVDDLCWGDPRYAPALTLAGIHAFGGPAMYVSAWMARSGHADDALFRCYVAICILGFLSERGEAANGNPAPRDPDTLEFLLAAFRGALAWCGLDPRRRLRPGVSGAPASRQSPTS